MKDYHDHRTCPLHSSSFTSAKAQHSPKITALERIAVLKLLGPSVSNHLETGFQLLGLSPKATITVRSHWLAERHSGRAATLWANAEPIWNYKF